MKQTFYILVNDSRTEGYYYLNNEYRNLYPTDKVELDERPSEISSNITLSVYQRYVGETILNKKKR